MANKADGSIVYEVELDYEKYKKGLESTKYEAKETGKAVEKNLGDGVEGARKNLDKLKDAQKELTKLYKSGDIGSKEYKALSDNIKESVQQIKENEKALIQSERAYASNAAKVSELSDKLAGLEAQADSLARQLVNDSGLDAFLETGQMTQAAYDEAVDSMLSANKEYQKLEKQINDTAEKVDVYAKKTSEATDKTEGFKTKAQDTAKAAHDLGKRIKDAGDSAENSAKSGISVLKIALGDLVARGINLAISALKEFVDIGIEYAANLETVGYRIENVFGSAGAKKIEDWANNSIDKMGLAEGVAKDYAATLGEIAVNANISKAKTYDFSTGLTEVIGKFASIRGIDPDKMFKDIQSSLTGGGRGLTEYGFKLKTLDSNMSDSEKAWVRYKEIIRQSDKIIGEAEVGVGGYTSELNKLKQTALELSGKFAQNFLPVLTEVLSETGDYLKENGEALANLGTIVATVANALANLIKIVGAIPAHLLMTISTIALMAVAFIKVSSSMTSTNGAILQLGKAIKGTDFVFDTTTVKIIALVAAVSVLLFLILSLKEGSDNAAKSIQSMGNVAVNATNSAKYSGHANGTLASPPGLFWVGEEGPELVRFRGGEQVYTAAQSARMARQGLPGYAGGTDTVPAAYNDYSSLTVYTNDSGVMAEVKDWWENKQRRARAHGAGV